MGRVVVGEGLGKLRPVRVRGRELAGEGAAGPPERVVSVRGGQTLKALKAEVAGDPSSAAFALAMALIAGEGAATVTGIPQRPRVNGPDGTQPLSRARSAANTTIWKPR